jgi:hypothetical protein
MNQKQAPSYEVKLNRETYDLLRQVKKQLTDELGFAPTMGQVIKHALVKAYPEAQVEVERKYQQWIDREAE